MENKVVLNDAGIINSSIEETSFTEEISSIFHGLGLAIKVSILLTLSLIYSVIALTAVIIYLIFFKRLFENLINRVRQGKRKSVYFYKWKKHHLDLKLEG